VKEGVYGSVGGVLLKECGSNAKTMIETFEKWWAQGGGEDPPKKWGA
jgi:hypothetical protein